MSYDLISEDVSIYSMPTLDTKYIADKNAQITIGDLHGNALKLIFVLVKHGIVTNMSEENYLELARIYRKDTNYLNSDDIKQFCTIINSLTFNTDAKLRLLGDELSDRGSNDYFTLKIIEKLRANRVPTEIILSNHSSEFISAYETKTKFFPSVMEIHFAASMIQMQMLITKKLITRDEVISIIKNSYKPFMKAVSYTLSEDLSGITLFSHAPIDIRAIRALAKRLAVPYEDFSAVALAKTIDSINETYQNYVDSNSIHSLYDKAVMEDGYMLRAFPALYNPVEYIMWNRDLTHLDLPSKYKGYNVTFVHGHDNEKSELEHMISLDNYLGKTMAMGEGTYTAMYSHEIQLSAHSRYSNHLHASNQTAADNTTENTVKATF